MSDFDYQPTLKGENTTVRALAEDDFEAIFLCASNPLIWAGHPAKDRYQREVFKQWFATALAGKALVFENNTDQQLIGSSRYYTIDTAPNDICIGFTFLGIDYWGGTRNSEIKDLMLAHAFESFEQVWFHIDVDNIRSQKATAKIGAKFIREEVNSISSKGSMWKCYTQSKSDWLKR